MQEQHGSEITRNYVAQIDDLVEIVQLAGVVEGGQNKAGQAQQEEMHGARRGTAAEINKQPDGQVHRAVGIKIEERRIAFGLRDNDVVLDLLAMAVVKDRILRRLPCAQPCQNLGRLQRILNLDAFNREQNVMRMQPRFGARTAGLHTQRDYANRLAGRLIDPDHAIIGQMVLVLLIEIEPCGNDSRNGHDHQQGADEL